MEYCWGTPLDRLKPPYDFVVACDCVYVERLVEALVSSMVNVSGSKTTVLVASEKREEVTYAKFRERLAHDFAVRQAPRRHMDKAYDHENSEVLLCKLRRGGNSSSSSNGEGEGNDRVQNCVEQKGAAAAAAAVVLKGEIDESSVLDDGEGRERRASESTAPTLVETQRGECGEIATQLSLAIADVAPSLPEEQRKRLPSKSGKSFKT